MPVCSVAGRMHGPAVPDFIGNAGALCAPAAIGPPLKKELLFNRAGHISGTVVFRQFMIFPSPILVLLGVFVIRKQKIVFDFLPPKSLEL